MTTPERDSQQPQPERREDRAVPADATDAVSSTDRTAPSDAAGKPLYAEQDLRQSAGAGEPAVSREPEVPATATAQSSTEQSSAAQTSAQQAGTQQTSQQSDADTRQTGMDAGQPAGRGEVHTIIYSAETGGVQVLADASAQREQAAGRNGSDKDAGSKDEGGVLDSLKETLLSRTEGLRQRGGQLAQTARLKMEVMQYSRDLESLYARLGRAYHHRAAAEILALIEQEIAQVERDIALRERQLDSQDVSRELHVQRARAERERPSVNLPDPTVPSVAGAFGIEERPPRTEHHLETEKRDTFFGLDKGGVDQQATVAGGNAAFDTQIEPEDSVVTLEDLEKADRNSR